MTLNNLELLDIDEHLRPMFEMLHNTLLDVCKTFELTLDLATSDNVMYLKNKQDDSFCIG